MERIENEVEGVTSLTRVVVGKDGPRTLPPQKLTGMTVKCVCAQCNNGWMSGLESAVKPFLVTLMLGKDPHRLDGADQVSMAAWTLKTMMMVEQSSNLTGDNVIPPSEYTHLYQEKKPSTRRTIIRAFHMTPPERDGSVVLANFTARRFLGKYRGYTTVLRFGALGLHLMTARLPAGIRMGDMGHTHLVSPLWPAREPFSWPPAENILHEVWDSTGGMIFLPHRISYRSC
ncbi:hypothetical protein [Streptomyces anulatus]|uniref:hypothetical protein n=1 Tax=Streptomyces anulatus TaxID=1892 RepID=UPI002F9193AF